MGPKRHFAREKGFTIVEIMMVIMVFSILLVVAVPNFNSARNEQYLTAEANKLKADLVYMQQLALEAKETCNLIYGTNSYYIEIAPLVPPATSVKTQTLESVVAFVGTGTISVRRDGIFHGSSFPLTISLTRKNSQIRV